MKCSLVSLILLKRSLVFPILLFSSISLHWSLRKVFLSLPPRAEKPHWDSRLWSSRCVALKWLLGNIPHPRAKEKPQQGGWRCETLLESNPIPTRLSEGSNILCAKQDPETPWRLRQNYVWVSLEEAWVSSGLMQGQGLWVQQTWVSHKPSWRTTPLTPYQFTDS